jgi:cytochrome P450
MKMEEDSAERPPIRNVISDGALAVIAGSDTTSGTLSVLWHYLLRHPAFRDRLQAEIDAFFPSPVQDPLNMSALAHMPYLNACL